MEDCGVDCEVATRLSKNANDIDMNTNLLLATFIALLSPSRLQYTTDEVLSCLNCENGSEGEHTIS